MYFKKIIFVTIILSSVLFSQTISETLNALEPFLGKTWTGKLKALDGSAELEVIRNYEMIFQGNVIKISKVNYELNNFGEGYFYWNDIKKQIAFFFIENKGVFCEGFVKAENNIITIEGTMTWPKQMNPDIKQSYDFRNTFEFTDDDKMIDRWYQNAFGPWQEGHVIMFEEMK